MVDYINNTDYNVDIDTLNKVIEEVKKEEKLDNIYFSVIFVDNEEIKKINKQ